MGMKIGTGWLAREAAGKAALAARDAGYNLAHTEKEQTRQAMYAAKAEEDRLAQEAADAKVLYTVSSCPCCAGKGHVAVAEAAKVVEALRRYNFVGWKPDVATIAELMRAAITVDRDGNPVAQVAPVPAAPPAPIMPVITMEDDAAGSDDDALAAYRTPETDPPVRHRGKRHVQPPFLDGGE